MDKKSKTELSRDEINKLFDRLIADANTPEQEASMIALKKRFNGETLEALREENFWLRDEITNLTLAVKMLQEEMQALQTWKESHEDFDEV